SRSAPHGSGDPRSASAPVPHRCWASRSRRHPTGPGRCSARPAAPSGAEADSPGGSPRRSSRSSPCGNGIRDAGSAEGSSSWPSADAPGEGEAETTMVGPAPRSGKDRGAGRWSTRVARRRDGGGHRSPPGAREWRVSAPTLARSLACASTTKRSGSVRFPSPPAVARGPPELPDSCAIVTIQNAIGLLRGRNVAVLSGAGVSTESGIPDYRCPESLAKGPRRPIQGPEFVRSERLRRRYWARAMAGWETFRLARPGPAHRALAMLEQEGTVAALITQNVDRLHHAAG